MLRSVFVFCSVFVVLGLAGCCKEREGWGGKVEQPQLVRAKQISIAVWFLIESDFANGTQAYQ